MMEASKEKASRLNIIVTAIKIYGLEKVEKIIQKDNEYSKEGLKRRRMMSTKSTMILTSDNEHWYKDCNGKYYEETSTEECIVLEIDPRHKVETDEEGTRIIIEENTPLYNELKKTFFTSKPFMEIMNLKDKGEE